MRRHQYYVLRGHDVFPAISAEQWAKEFEVRDRRVARTQITEDIEISTVFLGLDHNFGVDGPALLFETMVFGGTLDGEMYRYATWAEAEIGHARMAERVRQILRDPDDKSVVTFPPA